VQVIKEKFNKSLYGHFQFFLVIEKPLKPDWMLICILLRILLIEKDLKSKRDQGNSVLTMFLNLFPGELDRLLN